MAQGLCHLARVVQPLPSNGSTQGTRTLIAANFHPSEAMLADGRAHNETWVYYPDDVPLRSMYAGDSRAALMPFLAHKVFGATYKRVLYGDDDTIFFIDTILRLLHDFDEQLPYFITGAYTVNQPYVEKQCTPCVVLTSAVGPASSHDHAHINTSCCSNVSRFCR